MLKEVAGADEADRGRIIGGHLDRWTDNAAAAERFAELKKLIAPLRTSGFTLFVLAFIFGPALYYSPWPPSWPAVVIYFAMSLFDLDAYCLGLRSVPQEAFGRKVLRSGFATWACSCCRPLPPCDPRRCCCETVWPHFIPWRRPRRYARRTVLRQLARPMMLALEHPKPGEVPGDPAACRIDAWFRKKLLKRLTSLLRRVEIDPVELAAAGGAAVRFASRTVPAATTSSCSPRGPVPTAAGLALVAYAGELYNMEK